MYNHSDLLLSRSSKELFILRKEGVCDSCGGFGPFTYKEAINEALYRQWSLDKNQKMLISARESMNCYYCGCSYRLRLLSRAINYFITGNNNKSLLQNIEDGLLDNVSVAEINSCGLLHGVLKKTPNLHYSEYGSSDPIVPHEDLQSLSYSNSSFDIVLTSDVLEHVPDVKLALKETYRVLKPGGAHIMTVPVIMDRTTKRRAHMKDGLVVNDLEPSFHGSGEPDYLVWNEFGYDFIDTLREVGYNAHYLFVNKDDANDFSGVILAIKPKKGSKSFNIRKDKVIDNSFDPNWQLRYINQLINKIELTNNHVANLDEIIKKYKTKFGELIN